MQMVLDMAKNLVGDLNIAFMFHEDDDINDRVKVGKKIKTIGQMLEDKYNPLSIVSVCLFTNVTFNKDGLPEYGFITNRTMIDNITIPAKSPAGMFESNKIPNDLKLVFDNIKEYYNN